MPSNAIPTDQKWYHLSTILGSLFSLPMIVIGNQLAKLHGPGVAICSIIVGNLFLWIIGLTVVTMSIQERSNAIDNVNNYLGKYGAILMWIIMMLSILNWFALQLHFLTPSIGDFFHIEAQKTLVFLGIGIGLITALLSFGGIQLIKWATLITFPLIFFYHFLSMVQFGISISFLGTWGLSLSAIITTLLVFLPGIINLPTLFRHSQSKADSYLGLSIFIFLVSFYQIATIGMQFTDIGGATYKGYSFYSFITFIFLILTLIYINLANIYYVSALCEKYTPKVAKILGFSFGLVGTGYYLFIQKYNYYPIGIVSGLTNSFLAGLGIVLLISYLIRTIVQHRPRKNEKALNLFCWIIGCAVAAFFVPYNIEDYVKPLLMGVIASTSSFLVIIFIEENIWAMKKVLSDKQ